MARRFTRNPVGMGRSHTQRLAQAIKSTPGRKPQLFRALVGDRKRARGAFKQAYNERIRPMPLAPADDSGAEPIGMAPAQGRPGGPKARGTGVGGNYQPGLGGQLSRRVAAGEITQEQAQHTAAERRRLEEAYGPNWREEVFGGTGRMQEVRSQLAANPEDERLQQLNQRLLDRRKGMLQEAEPNGSTPTEGDPLAEREAQRPRKPTARKTLPTRRVKRRKGMLEQLRQRRGPRGSGGTTAPR